MDLPADRKEWEKQVEGFRLKKHWSIHESKHKNSGSKFTMEQFLLLWVLWPRHISQTGFETACTGFIELNNLRTARKFLQNLSSWQRYLGTYDDEECSGMDGRVVAKHQGTFALVRHYQNLSCKNSKVKPEDLLRKVEFTPASAPSTAVAPSQSQAAFPITPTPNRLATRTALEGLDASLVKLELRAEENEDISWEEMVLSPLTPALPLTGVDAKSFGVVEDEQIVNAALIDFLNALTLHCDKVKSEWSFARKRFKMNIRGDKTYEARVDGLLRAKGSRDTQIIVEAKSCLRFQTKTNTEAILMQEAAQMAAWICDHPPQVDGTTSAGKTRKTGPPCRRMLISQDAKEIYINVASFDSDYVRYVLGDNDADLSFLTMQSYGPFPVNKKKSMSRLGEILLALSIQGGLAQRRSEK